MNYYEEQLNRVQVGKTEYSPTIKVFANGNGEDTKHLSLNKESALELIHWLRINFVMPQTTTIGELVEQGKLPG